MAAEEGLTMRWVAKRKLNNAAFSAVVMRPGPWSRLRRPVCHCLRSFDSLASHQIHDASGCMRELRASNNVYSLPRFWLNSRASPIHPPRLRALSTCQAAHHDPTSSLRSHLQPKWPETWFQRRWTLVRASTGAQELYKIIMQVLSFC